MNDVIIVCAHDAVKTAQSIKRLLSAQDYNAQLVYGRTSVTRLEDVRDQRVAVVLIWSLDAASTDYMYRWADSIDPIKLAEIARAPGWPSLEKRRAHVIDFSAWGGERGGHAWRALEDRLRHIARATEPKKPAPMRPALALAGAGLIAAGAGLSVRVNHEIAPVTAQALPEMEFAETFAEGGRGGAMHIEEPASIDDVAVELRRTAPHVRMLSDAPLNGELVAVNSPAEPMSYPDPTLLDRLGALASPLLRRD